MTTWKPIPSAPNYEASDAGDIRRIGKSQPLVSVPNFGYPRVCLRVNGRNRNGRVHRLVAEAFLGPSDMEVNHKNGDKTDNRLVNLEYCTRAYNAAHAASEIGAYKRGSAVATSRLTERDIPVIWDMREGGAHLHQIAAHFEVSVGCVCFVLNGGSWRKESEALGKFAPRPRSTATA